MENATRALLLAGGILVGIIILSAGVMLYTGLNKNAGDYSSQTEIAALQTFNAEFEKYKGRTDVTPQDVVSIYNYIQQNAEKMPQRVAITVSGDTRYPANRYISK